MALLDHSIVSPILIGRKNEVATLERALTTVLQGRGQTLLISGEAGVGKSRLLGEITARATAQACTVIHGSCFEQDAAYPYSLWIDALRNHVAATSAELCQTAFGSFSGELTKLLPELFPPAPDSQHQPALDPETEKRRLFDALTYFLTTTPHPLLLVVEDLHWGDRSTLDFLAFFVRRVATLPLLLLITYRQHEAPPALQHFLAQLDRQHLGRELQLSPLSQAEVSQMVAAILNASQPLPAELLTEIYAYTEGNAFFVEEILKLWLAADELHFNGERWQHLGQTGLHIPRSVLDIVQQRTSRLSPAAHQTLTLAAVIGRRFDFALLPTLLELPESDVVPLVKELIASQLLVEESSDQLAFRHALTREAAYATLLRRERRMYHGRVLTAMEHLYGRTMERYWGELAHHAYEADHWQQAHTYSEHAGNQAQAMYAADEAAAHFTRAIEATRHLGQPPTTTLLRRRGKAYEILGDFEAARADFEAILHTAQQQQDHEAEWQALLDLGFVWSGHDYQAAGDYFQRALALAYTLDHPLLIAHSLNRVGNWYVNVQQPTLALDFHHDALARFLALDDQRGLTETYDLLGMTYQLSSNLVQSHRAFQQAIHRWQQAQDQFGLIATLACLPLCTASYLKNLDFPAIPFQAAISAAEGALQLAQSIHWRAGEAFAASMLSMCLGAQGNYPDAFAKAHQGLRIAEEIEHRQWTVAGHVALGTLYLDLLALDQAQSHLETALTLAKAVGSTIWIGSTVGVLASTYVTAGKLLAAQTLLTEELAPDTPMQMQVHRLMWFAKAELALAQADAPTALRIAQELTAATQNLPPDDAIPKLALLQGTALIKQGNLDAAIAILRAGLIVARHQQAPSMEWRILLALCNAFQTQRKRPETNESFAAARAILYQIASALDDVTMSRNLLDQALASVPTPPTLTPNQVAKQKAGGLTTREREVAQLVAAGKSNQEIATQLFVGIRTIEAHITRILDKLDFSSRVQIAAWVIKHGIGQ